VIVSTSGDGNVAKKNYLEGRGWIVKWYT
jgi:hypothetical protein